MLNSCNWLGIEPKGGASNLDISDASMLLLKQQSAKKSDAGTLSDGPSNLYKLVINENDSLLEQVWFTNSVGDFLDENALEMEVENVYQFNEDLYLLRGNFKFQRTVTFGDDKSYTTLLVRLSDGAVYDFNGHYPFLGSSYYGDYVQEDAAGNMYYNYVTVQQLTELANGDFAVQQYLPDGQKTDEFFIDQSGNCFYVDGRSDPLDTDMKERVKRAAGGILINEDYPLYYMFNGTLDGTTYCMWGWDVMQIIHVGIVEVGDTLSLTEVSTHYNGGATNPNYHFIYQDSAKGYTMFFRKWTEYAAIGELFSETDQKSYCIRQPEDFGDAAIGIFKVSGKYSFVEGENCVFRLDNQSVLPVYSSQESEGSGDPVAMQFNDFITFYFPEDIEMYSYDFYDEDTFIFTGLDLSTEENIIGVSKSDGTWKVIRRTGNDEYTILTRLN